MILTDDQYSKVREKLHMRVLATRGKQKEVTETLQIYFNIWFTNTKDTDKIVEEIIKDIARWERKDSFNPRFSTKGARLPCPEVGTCHMVRVLLDSIVDELKKSYPPTKPV